MTSDPSQTTDDSPPDAQPSAPHVAALRLADHWDTDTWRHLLVGAALGVLTLPAVAMAIVGLLVLAVQGVATWLLVTAAALVTAAVGALGTAVALRRGHRGVVHRLAVIGGVWGLVTTVAGVAVGLSPDTPERVGVAVLLVLGGTYTLVLALGLWGAWRVMPAPRADEAPAEPDPAPGPSARTGATPTVSEVPTPAVAPDDDTLADWPEWGGEPSRGAASRDDDPYRTAAAPSARPAAPADVEPEPSAPPTAPVAPRATSDDASDGVPGRTQARSTPPRGTSARSTSSGSTPGRSTASGSTPGRSTSPRSTPGRSTSARGTSSTAPRTASTAPPRRSATSADPAGPSRAPSAGDVTERIARQDGDDGPPTQRIPPVLP